MERGESRYNFAFVERDRCEPVPLCTSGRQNELSAVRDAPPALLVLADGTIFRGTSVGAPGIASGEVVFNTAITGYQEILSDPSYCRQIVTLTHPHIGNTGTNAEDMESAKVFAAGLVVRDVPSRVSNWRAQRGLGDFLVANEVPAIAGLDTRRLTRILREKGSQNGALLAGSDDVERALVAARAFPGLAGMDLAKVVTTEKRYEWTEGKWKDGGGFAKGAPALFHVAAYDYGVKRNILRLLVERGCRVTVLPAQTPAAEVLALKADGVFLSNGPGDPEPCDYAIEAIRAIIDAGVPTFGICLGHQLMGLASGAKTVKMKFGHHGANHPVKDLETGTVVVTSRNNGFPVDPATRRRTRKRPKRHT